MFAEGGKGSLAALPLCSAQLGLLLDDSRPLLEGVPPKLVCLLGICGVREVE